MLSGTESWPALRRWLFRNGGLLGLLWGGQLLGIDWGPVQPIRSLTSLLFFTGSYSALGLLGLFSRSKSVSWWHVLADFSLLWWVCAYIALVAPEAMTKTSLWDNHWGVGLVVCCGGIGMAYLSRNTHRYVYLELTRSMRIKMGWFLMIIGILVVLTGMLA